MSDWEKLFDFNQDFDVNLLESIIVAASSPQGQSASQWEMASKIAQRFQEDPQAWTRVPTILEHAQLPITKRYALSVMDSLVSFRWNILTLDQQRSIREYMISFVMELSSNPDALGEARLILDKANGVVVSIARQDWPTKWPDFIPDIVEASKGNECTCENNLSILTLLSEEIFDFSEEKMTRAKIQKLKGSLVSGFFPIFSLCEFVLANSKKTSLIRATLEALHRFLSWIPEGYVFETDVVSLLISNFLPDPNFRLNTLNCLIEVASIPTSVGDMSKASFQQMTFVEFMKRIGDIIPIENTDIPMAYATGSIEEKKFVQMLSLYLTTLFKAHLTDLESDSLAGLLITAHQYLVQFCYVRDKDIFRTVLEYWTFLSQGLYNEAPVNQGTVAIPTQRRSFYSNVLKEVRALLISNMAKPEEYLIIEDENGVLIRERMKNTEQLDLYKTMKETLVYLANLDMMNTEEQMLSSLATQAEQPDNFNKRNCSTLCWAIGSISGVQTPEAEKVFLVKVIKTLIDMCNGTRIKDHRAVIAGNIMYVVGQYPRFLKAYWTFLKTVVTKLFEWMSEPHPGVQDMACDTFLKIARRTKSRFVTIQPRETVPYVDVIIEHVPNLIADLTESQVYTFYSAVGELISAAHPDIRGTLTSNLMMLPNQSWMEIMNNASQDVNSLRNTDVIRKIAHLINTNMHACQRIGYLFVGQIEHIYLEMLNVYKIYSEDISSLVSQQGPRALNLTDVKARRSVKAAILLLLQTFIGATTRPEDVVQQMLPPLLTPVLEDYRNGIQEAREPQVLGLVTALVTKCNELIADDIPNIFDSVFSCTMDMIAANLTDFPDHRVQFFNFLRAVNRYCFPALLAMSPENFKLIVDSTIWAFRHTMRDVSKTGLQLLFELLENVERADAADAFYSSWCLTLLNELLVVLTDGYHKSEMTHQARVLAKLFSTVQSNLVTSPIWESSGQTPSPGSNNTQFIGEFTSSLVSNAFPNLSPAVVTSFVQGMMITCSDHVAFKKHLQDFLVVVLEVSDPNQEDNIELYREDMAAAETSAQLLIPGMIAPDDPRRQDEIDNTVDDGVDDLDEIMENSQ